MLHNSLFIYQQTPESAPESAESERLLYSAGTNRELDVILAVESDQTEYIPGQDLRVDAQICRLAEREGYQHNDPVIEAAVAHYQGNPPRISENGITAPRSNPEALPQTSSLDRDGLLREMSFLQYDDRLFLDLLEEDISSTSNAFHDIDVYESMVGLFETYGLRSDLAAEFNEAVRTERSGGGRDSVIFGQYLEIVESLSNYYGGLQDYRDTRGGLRQTISEGVGQGAEFLARNWDRANETDKAITAGAIALFLAAGFLSGGKLGKAVRGGLKWTGLIGGGAWALLAITRTTTGIDPFELPARMNRTDNSDIASYFDRTPSNEHDMAVTDSLMISLFDDRAYNVPFRDMIEAHGRQSSNGEIPQEVLGNSSYFNNPMRRGLLYEGVGDIIAKYGRESTGEYSYEQDEAIRDVWESGMNSTRSWRDVVLELIARDSDPDKPDLTPTRTEAVAGFVGESYETVRSNRHVDSAVNWTSDAFDSATTAVRDAVDGTIIDEFGQAVERMLGSDADETMYRDYFSRSIENPEDIREIGRSGRLAYEAYRLDDGEGVYHDSVGYRYTVVEVPVDPSDSDAMHQAVVRAYGEAMQRFGEDMRTSIMYGAIDREDNKYYVAFSGFPRNPSQSLPIIDVRQFPEDVYSHYGVADTMTAMEIMVNYQVDANQAGEIIDHFGSDDFDRGGENVFEYLRNREDLREQVAELLGDDYEYSAEQYQLHAEMYQATMTRLESFSNEEAAMLRDAILPMLYVYSVVPIDDSAARKLGLSDATNLGIKNAYMQSLEMYLRTRRTPLESRVS